MGANRTELASAQLVHRAFRPTWGDAAVDRVRCVLRCRQKFLLAEHPSRRRGKAFKWGLPGGRLRANEKPGAGLRRELFEELRLRAPSPLDLGDWWYRGENYRVFGASLPRFVEWFHVQEIRSIAWLSYAQVVELADEGLLHKGFELEAITEYQRRFRS